MSESTYPITLPDGQERGPLLLRDVKKAALDGVLPYDATLVIGGVRLTIEEAICRATDGRGPRMTPEERAILGETRASTPMALLAEAEKVRR